MGLDLSFTKKHGSSNIIQEHLPKPEEVDGFLWSHVEGSQLSRQQPFESLPTISEFNIYISDSTNSPESLKQSNDSLCDSVYEFPEGGSFSSFNNFDHLHKKSVRFTNDTVFIERNMNSPFWKEITDRKLKRKRLRHERRLRTTSHSSMSLYDFFKFLFTSKKPIVMPPPPPQIVHKSVSMEDLHSTLSQQQENPLEHKNSTWEKFLISIRAWGTRKNLQEN